MSILVLSHNDNDGFCAGAIAYRELKERYEEEEIICIEMDYDKSIPKNINFTKVFILDFSLDKSGFKYMIDSVGFENITWIDHHISAIRKFPEYKNMDGIRTEGTSGCLLTWQYFHLCTDIVPYIVELINDYDIWEMKYGNETLNFYEYSKILPMSDIKNSIWDELLSLNRDNEEMKNMIEMGSEYRKMLKKQISKYVQNLGIPITLEWEGKKYSCIKMNMTMTDHTSQFGYHIYDQLGYDIAWMSYIKTTPKKKLIRVNQLRSIKVDVSRIASKYGGGGHPNAAGWTDDLECDMNNYVKIL